MDIWAISRRDHGMSWREFEDTTFAQLEALEKRRANAIRHERFNAALVAASVLNGQRAQDSEPVSPFDFLAGFDRDPAEVERERSRKAIKREIAVMFSRMKSLEQVQDAKRGLIQRLEKAGVDDAEGLIREVYPDI